MVQLRKPVYFNQVELERDSLKQQLCVLEKEHEQLRKESAVKFHLGSSQSMKYYIHKMNILTAKMKAIRCKRIRCPPNGSYCMHCYVLYDKACRGCDTRGRVLEGFCSEKCRCEHLNDIRDGLELADDIEWLFK